MDIISAIKTRRSIREFARQDINDKVLFKILDAANYAPAAGGLYNWRFIVVKNPEDKALLSEASYEQEFVRRAPVIIVVCSDSKGLKKEFGKNGEIYAIQNATAAMQNMILAAHEFNVASCLCGVNKQNAIRISLKIPENIDICGLVLLGYPKRQIEMPSKADLSAVIFFDTWNNRIKKNSPLFPLIDVFESAVKKAKRKTLSKRRK
ncbi:MAG: nitroreductase family protein [Nanoarchaeota archaeon]